MQQTKMSNVQTTCNANMATIFSAEKQNKNQNLQKGKQAKRAALADEKKTKKGVCHQNQKEVCILK